MKVRCFRTVKYIIISKYKDYLLVVSRNEYVVAEPLMYLYGDNNEDYEKYTVTNILFESIVTAITNNLCNKRILDFVNKLEFSD